MMTTSQSAAVETLHGVTIEDPYQWLEDRTLPETESWIQDQRRRYDAYFAEFHDLDLYRSRVEEYLDQDWYDQPCRLRNRLFYRHRKKGYEQACICVREGRSSEERVLVDPASLGPFASVNIHSISEDTTLLAYELRFNGSDSSEIHFVDTILSRILKDYLPKAYSRGFAFSYDSSACLYCHEVPNGNADHEIRRHSFGHDLNKDVVLFRVPRTSGSSLSIVADDTHVVAAHIRNNSDAGIDLYLAMHQQPLLWHRIAANKSYPFVPYPHNGRVFVRTDQEAPNGKIIELLLDGSPGRQIVPESESLIQEVAFVNDRVFVSYHRDRRTTLDQWALDGRYIGPVDLVTAGPVSVMCAPRSDSSLFYAYETFTQPPRLIEHVPGSGSNELFSPSQSGSGPNYRTQDITYEANDGTAIPMLLIASEGHNLGQPSPTLLTSYGGFGVSATPRFAVMMAVLLELGVVIAIPGIRGGSEFGRKWHEAARKTARQTAFEDFIGAAEWLISHSVTQSSHLALYGASNSGLMVGAVLTQRPDLIRAVVCVGPLLDMIRYELFDRARRWTREYGSVDTADEFSALLKYSPYHRVERDINYPSTLFVTGDSDDRCNPAHVRKMAARLIERHAQTNPIVVDYSIERGHHPGLPLSIRINALARRVAFLAKELDIHISDGGLNEACCS